MKESLYLPSSKRKCYRTLKTTLTFRSFIPLNRGAPKKRKKKKADRRARACLVFPILWTLDPLSLGFNFYSLSPPSLLSPVSPYVTELEVSLLVRLSPPRFLPLVIRRSRPADVIQARCTRRQCCLVLVCGTRRCTMRQQSGAAPLPAGDLRASPLTIISSLFLIFSSFFFLFFIQYP